MQLVTVEMLKVTRLEQKIEISYFKIFEFSLYIEMPSAEGIPNKLESWIICWWFLTYHIMGNTTISYFLPQEEIPVKGQRNTFSIKIAHFICYPVVENHAIIFAFNYDLPT